jgi:hypothetical protein
MKQASNSQTSGQEQGRKNLPVSLDPDQGSQWRFKAGTSGNPKGRPKGIKNLSTEIKHMLNDPDFIDRLPGSEKADLDFQGTPMRAIITAAILKALNGDDKSREWLGKFGYGSRIEVTGEDGAPLMPISLDEAIFARMQDADTSALSPEEDRA